MTIRARATRRRPQGTHSVRVAGRPHRKARAAAKREHGFTKVHVAGQYIENIMRESTVLRAFRLDVGPAIHQRLEGAQICVINGHTHHRDHGLGARIRRPAPYPLCSPYIHASQGRKSLAIFSCIFGHYFLRATDGLPLMSCAAASAAVGVAFPVRAIMTPIAIM